MLAQSDLIHMFNGIPFSTRVPRELLQSLDSFEAREDDVLLVSYPKSGTHWLTEILKHLYHSQQDENGGGSATLTSPIEFGDPSKFEELKNLLSLRLIPTHLNYKMLPVQFKAKKCKMIYIIRNPKDTAVSLYHYYRENPNLPKIEKWATFVEMFLKGEVVCGSWWDHILSWEEHKNDENVLILYYESMKKDLTKSIEQISNFLDVNVTIDQIREISRRSSFNEMKEEAQRENPALDHTVCVLTSNRGLIFRKGTVGDWKNHFTSEQNKLFEEQFGRRMNSSELAKSIEYES
ncbi:sulfotransferase 6B1-like [Heptranchias perlo]|uniref:sulfotransferase 6B1-like n=1 Tax=Heptranchias perlo TaxID=212740 RepID=UPI003559D936